MSAIIGTVSRVTGQFSVQRVNGTVSELAKNDEIYEGDTVRGSGNTSELNTLVVNMVDGVDVVMRGDESQLFDASLLQDEFAENETVTDIESIEAMVDDVDFIGDIQDDVDDIDTEAGDEEVITSSTDTKMNDFAQNNEEIQDINAELKDVDREEKKSTLDNEYQENRESSASNEEAINSEVSDIVSNMSELIDAANAATLAANIATDSVNAAAQAADNNPSVENLEAAERAQITANIASTEAATAALTLEDVIANLNAVAARVGKDVDTTEAVIAVQNANEASTTAINAATASEIVTDNEIAEMVSNLTNLINIANVAAQNANVLADEADEAVRLANETSTLENLNRAQYAQGAASQAANSSVDAASALENALSQLEEAADAANEEISSEVIMSANGAIDSADNSADNANQSANENLHVSTIVDSDASDNSIDENVADGTYTGVTLNAVDVDGEEVTYNITDDVPFRVEADGRVVVDGDNAIDFESTQNYTFDVTATSTDGTISTQSVTIEVNNINEAPQIENTQTISMTEDSLDGFTGYGSTWSGDVYSIVTQAEMLSHLNISDVDSNDFTVTLANHDDGSSYHHGLQATDSAFSNTTSNRYDEMVIQVTQEFLDTYPQIDAQVGDFYFDNVEFDKLGEGESANISFGVVVNDGELTSEAHTVNIEVTGSNDAPIITVTDTTATEDIAQIIANVSDVDGTIDTSILTAENGTVTIADNGDITYTPNADFNGNDTVSISVTDNGGETTTQTFNVSVDAVNDGPIAVDDGNTNVGHETAGATSGVTVTGIYRNGSDENVLDGVEDTLVTSRGHSYFEHGAFGHTGYNYMGGHHWFNDHGISLSDIKGGVITFSDGTVGVIDAGSNGAGATESSYIYYNAADNIEIGQAYFETTEDRALRIDVLSNDSDADGDAVILMDVENPVTNANGDAIGTAVISGGRILFTPNDEMDKLGAGESQDVQFNYTVSDGNGATDAATVNIKVMGTNDGPVVGDDIHLGTIDEDASIEFTEAQLLANSSDIDTNDILSVNSLSSDNGTISDLGDGNFRFTPNENYNGDVNISFNVNDGHTNVSSNATLSINSVNDGPVASEDGKVDGTIDTHADYGDMVAGAGNSVTVTGIYAAGSDINMLDGKPELETLNDYRFVGDDQDRGYNYMGNHDYFSDNGINTSQMRGGVVTFSDGSVGIIDSASNGVERDRDGDGTIDYEENAYIYYKSYEDLHSSTIVTDEDSAITIDVLVNDTDADGDTLEITEIQGQDVSGGQTVDVTDGDTVLGTATVVDGKVEFTPSETLQEMNDGENQDVSFEYTISDGTVTDTANVTVNVTGANEIVVGTNDNDTITGTSGNDEISGLAGNDTIYAGAGDDTISLDVNDSVMDGGEGLDTLVATDNIEIDFSALSDNISNIETIDLGAGEQNITSLSVEDVLDMTDTDNLLRIDGDSNDSIDLNTQGDDAEWTLGDFKTDAETGATYQEVTGEVDGQNITLEISTDVTIDES